MCSLLTMEKAAWMTLSTMIVVGLCHASSMDDYSNAFNFKGSGHWQFQTDLKHHNDYTDGKRMILYVDNTLPSMQVCTNLQYIFCLICWICIKVNGLGDSHDVIGPMERQYTIEATVSLTDHLVSIYKHLKYCYYVIYYLYTYSRDMRW